MNKYKPSQVVFFHNLEVQPTVYLAVLSTLVIQIPPGSGQEPIEWQKENKRTRKEKSGRNLLEIAGKMREIIMLDIYNLQIDKVSKHQTDFF